MLRVRRTSTVILTTMLLAATAACGSDDGPLAASGDGGGSGSLGPQLTVTLDLTGAVTVGGEQTAAAPSNNGALVAGCAGYAGGSTRDGETFYVAAGLLDGPVADHQVTLEMWIEDYTGPCAYAEDKLTGPGSPPSIAVDGKVYATWPDSTTSEVVTDGDGGGRWTFTKLATAGPGGLPGDTVDGSVRWTCRNP